MRCWECRRKGYLFRCRRCGKYFCGNCRLPEDHNCIIVRQEGHFFERYRSKQRIRETNKKIIKWFLFIGAVIGIYLLFQYYQENKQIIDNKISEKIEKASETIEETIEIEPPDNVEIESYIFDQTNNQRNSNGVGSLILSSELSDLAREHSLDMLERGFFDHINPEGEGPTERAERKGIRTVTDFGSYQMIGIAENINNIPIGDVIGCGYVYDEIEIANCAMNGWMSSSGHRANILDNQYQEIGVGVACDSSECMLTQEFR